MIKTDRIKELLFLFYQFLSFNRSSREYKEGNVA